MFAQLAMQSPLLTAFGNKFGSNPLYWEERMDLSELNTIIVRAKSSTYVGGGQKCNPSRLGSHDLRWSHGEWSYLDSYFGGTDFIGQETIWYADTPVWAMNYYGHIKAPQLINAVEAGGIIKGALSQMYEEGRFLGGYRWQSQRGIYVDTNSGDAARFHGREAILVQGQEAYVLDYFGGLIKE
jgi:hypothetical protein